MAWWTALPALALKAYNKTFDFINRREKQKDRADAESVGAAKQRDANQKKALETKDEQLKEAINARPGDGHDAADRGMF